MERVSRAFLFHEGLSAQDEDATLEEALEHVLWYYPAEDSPTERVKHVGLAQAMVSFADRFHRQPRQRRPRQEQRRLQGANDVAAAAARSSRDCWGCCGQDGGSGGGRDRGSASGASSSSARVEVVRTNRHCHGFLECEPGVWLVMVLVKRLRRDAGNAAVTRTTSPPSTRNRLRSAVFGRGIGGPSSSSSSSTSSLTSLAAAATAEGAAGSRDRSGVRGGVVNSGKASIGDGGRHSPPSPFSPLPSFARLIGDGATSGRRGDLGVGGSSVGAGAAGGAGGGAGGDWVDESSLRAAMARAYETFALTHGMISDTLHAPVAAALLPRPRTGSEDGPVSGFEVLARLASARRRLRKATRETSRETPAAQDHAGRKEYWEGEEVNEVEKGGESPSPSRPPSSSPSPLRRGLASESRAEVQKESELVAALLRASPAEPLRETLEDFFSGYLPGAGLAEPHFQLDLGYPQSLPMDLHRHQLGVRIQRRVRRRISSILTAAGDVQIDVDVAMTLANGALMLACMDLLISEAPEETPDFPGIAAAPAAATAGEDSESRSSDEGGEDDGEVSDRESAGGGGGGGGGRRVDDDLSPGASSAGGGGSLEDPGSGSSGAALPRQDRNGFERRERALLDGREASLLMGYLCAVASTVDGMRNSGSLEGATGKAAAAGTSWSAGVDSGRNRQAPGPLEDDANPPNKVWATFRSGTPKNGPKNGDSDGVLDVGDDGGGGGGGGGGGFGRDIGDGSGGRSAVTSGALRRRGLLRCDGSLACCDQDSLSSRDTKKGDASVLGSRAIWAPQLHRIGHRGTWGPAQALEEEEETRRGPPPPRPPASVALGGRGAVGRREAGYGHRQRRRQVVAYVRGGLCVLVVFRERDKSDGEASAPSASERSAASASASVSTLNLPGGEQEVELVGDSAEDAAWEGGWSERQLLSLGRAIETSLSEDPNLAVLEDDVTDFYCQSAETEGNAGEGRFESGGLRRLRERNQQQNPQQEQQQYVRPVPVRVVHHQSSPVPCFSGVGLVQHPPAPTTARGTMAAAAAAAASDERVSSPTAKSAGIHDDSQDDAQADGVLPDGDNVGASGGGGDGGGGGGDSDTGRGGCRRGCLLVVNRKRPPAPGKANGSNSSSTGSNRSVNGSGSDSGSSSSNGSFFGGKFAALIEAFNWKGRADHGVESTRRRGPGGEHEIAALDDIHCRLKIQPAAGREGEGGGGGGCVVPHAFVARELGIRTSTAKGNRWTIGRLLPAGGGDDAVDGSCGDRFRGEAFTTLEAPIISVGDARAAAGAALASAGCYVGVATKPGAGSDDGAATRTRAQDMGRGRRRFLR